MSFVGFYYGRYRIEVTEKGISAGYLRLHRLDWSQVNEVNAVNTMLGPLAKQRGGIELVGERDRRKQVVRLPLVEMRKQDAEALARIVQERTRKQLPRLKNR